MTARNVEQPYERTNERTDEEQKSTTKHTDEVRFVVAYWEAGLCSSTSLLNRQYFREHYSPTGNGAECTEFNALQCPYQQQTWSTARITLLAR